MRIEERAVLDLLPQATGRRVLDVACGSGRYLRILAERGAALVLGCDLSRPMLDRARALSPSLAESDMRRLPFADSCFDMVVCGLALGDVADLESAVGEMARVLRPGGAAIWSDLHPDAARFGWMRTFQGSDGRSYVIPHHAHGLDEHHAACRKAGLAIDEVREVPADEGPHRGRPAALVIRAVKAADAASRTGVPAGQGRVADSRSGPGPAAGGDAAPGTRR